MRVLVTGANGYLGRGIIDELLALGNEVIATDLSCDRVNSKAKRVEGNLFEVKDPYHYFNEPGLTREKIAQKVGVSTRYLAKLFAQTGTTVMDRLKEIRLTRASVQLTEEHMAHASIQEIAKTNGFASTAHFCRAFKERFEMTPRQWRQAHLDFNETENP